LIIIPDKSIKSGCFLRKFAELHKLVMTGTRLALEAAPELWAAFFEITDSFLSTDCGFRKEGELITRESLLF